MIFFEIRNTKDGRVIVANINNFIHIEKFNMWIELDGVGRKRRQDFLKKKYGNSINDYWETKMLEYDKNELNLKVFTCFSDFKNFITSLYK